MSNRLLVVVSERISEWIAKGEVVDRYYNPGDRFDEVHVLLTNDDAPDAEALQRLVGRATPFVHNLTYERRLLLTSAGWRPRLLRSWAKGAVEIARTIRPSLVRCYGAHLNAVCALEIRRRLGLPVVVSLHTLPDDPTHPDEPWLWPRVEQHAIRAARAQGLREADATIAVYASLEPYLRRLGARRVVRAYNPLNDQALRVKDDYALGAPASVLCVGRLIPGKDPTDVVDAVAGLPGVGLTVIGDGPLRAAVEERISGLGVGDRVRLVTAVPNDELVASLASYDLFAARNDYDGLPKAILEPLLAGLPVVVNRPPAVPELADGVVLPVAPSADGFRSGIQSLLGDRALRERVGRGGRAWAAAQASPAAAEAQVAALYDELVAARRANTN